MLTSSLGVILSLLVAVCGLIVVFVLMVVWFKIHRDRLEELSRRRQSALMAAWEAKDRSAALELLQRAAHGHTHEIADVAAALKGASAESWFNAETSQAVALYARDSGLLDRLERDLTSRFASRRGLSVLLGGYPATPLSATQLATFTRDPDPTVRLAAVASLSRQATPAAAHALIECLDEGTLPSARVIERLGYPWAVPTIVEALITDAVKRGTRPALLQALAMTGDPAGIEIALRVEVHEPPEERIQAMRILEHGIARATADQRALIAGTAIAMADDPLPNVRSLAMTVLASVDHPDRLHQLYRGAQDPDWFTRRAAARSLAACGSEGISLLHQIADGVDPFAAQRAREELAVAGAPHPPSDQHGGHS